MTCRDVTGDVTLTLHEPTFSPSISCSARTTLLMLSNCTKANTWFGCWFLISISCEQTNEKQLHWNHPHARSDWTSAWLLQPRRGGTWLLVVVPPHRVAFYSRCKPLPDTRQLLSTTSSQTTAIQYNNGICSTAQNNDAAHYVFVMRFRLQCTIIAITYRDDHCQNDFCVERTIVYAQRH